MGVHTLLWAKRQVFSVFFGKLRKHVYVCVWVCVRSQYIDRPQESENSSTAELQGTISVSQLFFFPHKTAPIFLILLKLFILYWGIAGVL